MEKKYRVLPLEISGKGKAIHKSGDVLELSQIPGGESNVESMISDGILEVIEDSEDNDLIDPKDAASSLIEEAKALEEDNDLIGALEKLNEAIDVYPEGRKAPKLISEINEKLG